MAKAGRNIAKQTAVAMLAAAGVAMLPSAAAAQRGGAFVEQAPAPDTPRRGFPGAFNTHMAERGSFVANIPFLQLDYGATENLTVGVNLLPTMPALAGETPGALARLRYRLYEDERISAVAALQVGYAPLGLEAPEDPDRAWGAYASTTIGYRLSERQRIAGTLMAATVRMANDDRLERYAFGVIGLALDYEAFLTDHIGINLTALGAPTIATEVDGPTATASVSLRPSLQDRMAIRALALWRLGDTWLLEGGGIAPLSMSAVIPWLSLTKTW